MPRNLVTPFSRSPRTGPSVVEPGTKSGAASAFGSACTLPISPHNNASAHTSLRISPSPSVGLLALNVSDDLPDLVRRQLVLPGRHPARRAVGDGAENLARLAAIEPAIVREVRSHAAGQVIGMTAGTVHLPEQRVARVDRVGFAGHGI